MDKKDKTKRGNKMSKCCVCDKQTTKGKMLNIAYDEKYDETYGEFYCNECLDGDTSG